MNKQNIKHENLRNVMAEIQKDYEGASEEAYDRLFKEFIHSNLICAGEKHNDEFKFSTVKFINGMELAALFTDMDEFRKVFPDFDVESHEFPFRSYVETLKKSKLYGIIVNIESEAFVMPKDVLIDLDDEFSPSFSDEDSYTSNELKDLKDSIDNGTLEEFIANPENIGRYEELFDLISESTMLTMLLSRDDLTCHAEDGIISMKETGPLGYHYTEKGSGQYATVFTSESKMDYVTTPLNKYSQIVNFAQMVYHILQDDLDGIIINPGSENILLTRAVLLEFSPIVEKTCNDSRLNTAIFHMFLMEA